jgi:hypothetical protein
MCDQIKEELINLLIHSDRKYYDLTALAEHQAAVAAKKMAALVFRGRQASNRPGAQDDLLGGGFGHEQAGCVIPKHR